MPLPYGNWTADSDGLATVVSRGPTLRRPIGPCQRVTRAL